MQFNSEFKHVELHSHLDGTLQAETLLKIAKRRGHKIPFDNSTALRNFLIIKTGTDLRNFLQKFDTALPIVAGDKEAIADMCDDYIRICAEAHICYVEPRFSAETLSGDGCDADSVVVTVLDTLKRSGLKYGVNSRVILSAMRHQKQCSPNVLDLARKYGCHGVVGIDVAGDEKFSFDNKGTSKEIVEMFKHAYKENIHRTVHAGENGSVAMIEEAVNEMHAERIGHGYQILQNEEIYEKMRNKNIHFEVCPSSSFLTGAVSSQKHQHPIHRFHKDQINYSISCDDLMITGRNLLEEYEFCRDSLGITHEEIQRCNLNAAMASFLNADDKKALLEHLKN